MNSSSPSLNLPVKVSQEQLEQNPALAKLLCALADGYLTKNGQTPEREQELQQTKAALEKEKQKYFYNKLILDNLREIVNGRSSTGASTQRNEPQAEMILDIHELTHMLNISTIADESSKVNLLGVTESHLKKVHNLPKASSNTIGFLHDALAEIEEVTKQQCEELIAFCKHGPCDIDVDDFSNSIHKLKNKLDEERNELNKEKEKIESQYWYFYKQLVACIESLGLLIEEYKLKNSKNISEIYIKSLQERVATMRMKLKSIRYEYLRDTYTPEAVQALRNIRGIIDKEQQAVQIELARADDKLSQYKTLGMGFDKLVDEYEEVLREIQKNQWTLSNLH